MITIDGIRLPSPVIYSTFIVRQKRHLSSRKMGYRPSNSDILVLSSGYGNLLMQAAFVCFIYECYILFLTPPTFDYGIYLDYVLVHTLGIYTSSTKTLSVISDVQHCSFSLYTDDDGMEADTHEVKLAKAMRSRSHDISSSRGGSVASHLAPRER